MNDKKAVNSFCLDNLRSLIDKKKSRTEIAAALGCDVSTIAKHYNGSRDVTTEYVLKYAKYFNVSSDYILGLTEYKTALDNEEGKTIRLLCDYTGLNEKSVYNLKKAWEHDEKKHHLRNEPFYVFNGSILEIINTFLSDYDLLNNLADNASNFDLDVFGSFDSIKRFMSNHLGKTIHKEDISDVMYDYCELREYYQKAQFDRYCFIKNIELIFDNSFKIYLKGFDNPKSRPDSFYDLLQKAAELGVKITDIEPDFPFFEDGENNGNNTETE